MQTTIDSVLTEIRAGSSSNRELGDRFERLMKGYLTTDPLYLERFESVWLWQDWPDRASEPDTGVDLVALERDGGVCAIQCKFYEPDHRLEKSDIDSFFTASGKSPFTSRLIISTTDHWSVHAEKALDGQQIPVTRLRVRDLAASPVDWTTFSISAPQEIGLRQTKTLRPHQEDAVAAVLDGLGAADRGKLIMACGTGKTLTSLRIAEALSQKSRERSSATVLFLVPSISLLSQTVREWTAETDSKMRAFAVCSDTKVGRRSEDISRHDLAFNATTDPRRLLDQVRATLQSDDGDSHRLSVIFSTYQSLAVIHEAQGLGLAPFDLVICDEAHRTTGATLAGDEESHFVRVHDGTYINSRKRLYMTATPRLFDDSTKSRAKKQDAVLCSMDDQLLFGAELHRLGFGEAVERGLLTDYKVLVLAVEEEYVAKTFQHQLADANSELNLDDAVKIAGCWNGLIGRGATGDGDGDRGPMHRAVAFSRSIKDSKRIAALFEEVTSALVRADDPDPVRCVAHHVDGTFNALRRNAELDWLRRPLGDESRTCRILSNARCLSEGVDVPGLDAVMFLNPRNSVVDVVQSVGRVMRKAEGKEYGYIVLPVGVPADMAPEEALRDNKKYKVVWQTLQALRAHDDRFNATINKIDLSKSRPDSITVIGMPGAEGEGRGGGERQLGFTFPIEEWRDAIYAKIVEKCGDRLYWESWASDVAQIAERHSLRIRTLLDDPNSRASRAFDQFLEELRSDINPSLEIDDAVEMLSQHLITKPVFDALFDGYDFASSNPVSQTMQRMLDALGDQDLDLERESLDEFYESVRMRASGIDSDEGRQRIITELYEKFFRNAFPKLADRLGIVYTPIEVVDFMVRSVEEVLRTHFDCRLGDEDVHVLDPFTGTGTFLVRMIQTGVIGPADLARTFSSELHANEIVLLAYYIAAINIESAFHQSHGGEYRPFPGIVLTDTFQLAEKPIEFEGLEQRRNHERVIEQQDREIRVVIGNPPYSVGQGSQNDANQNLKYPAVDGRIDATYVARSDATLRRNLYDSYVRALRWASDRIGDKGAVAFVTNGYFIDGRSFDGLRRSLVEEFDAVYCINLRGNQRGVQGEDSRREGGKVFGSGSRAPVAITLLIKDGSSSDTTRLKYFDIGEYLSREQKLEKLRDLGDIRSVTWQEITPSPEADWIGQIDPAYLGLLPIASKERPRPLAIFEDSAPGLSTNRDPWVYNFDRASVEETVAKTIETFDEEVERIDHELEGLSTGEARELVERSLVTDPTRISWSRSLKERLVRRRGPIHLARDHFVISSYRPFCKQWVYFDGDLNEASGGQTRFFPTDGSENLAIVTTGPGARRPFSALMVDTVPNLHLQDSGQVFARYRFDPDEAAGTLLEQAGTASSRSNISPEALHSFQTHYGDTSISADDLFFYVYGALHAPDYRARFADELRKTLARLPMPEDFWTFSRAGRELADLHLGYEHAEPFDLEERLADGRSKEDVYRVTKMRFGDGDDRSIVILNERLTLVGIPSQAYDYVVNGRSAIEWIMDRYQVGMDTPSGIRNDPNAYSDDPRYIVELLKKVVTVSLKTQEVVQTLPSVDG